MLFNFNQFYYMYFKFFLLLLSSLFIGNQFFYAQTSQNNQVSQTRAIKGIILDTDTETAISYVTMTLFKKGSTKPYKVKVSESDGSFSFADVIPGTYRLEGKLLGYIAYDKILDVGREKDNNLGNIFMKTDSKLLKAVEVKGIRSNMKLEIDKKTYSVDNSIAAAGASASDILKDIPSVEVDAEGTITLRNSESVTVWINGKPSGLTSDNRGQVLEQLPAESIESVEVVTNPSAKYSPEGSAGIINIILKKERKSGYYGSIRGGVSYPWGKNFGANLNYSSSKLDAYANIGLRDNEHDGSGYTKRQTYSTDELTTDTSYMNSNSKHTSGGDGLFMRAGFDYHLNNKHTLSLSGFAMDGNHKSNSEITYDYLDNYQLPTKQSFRNSVSDAGHNNYNITMDYLWEIGEDHSLQTNLSRGKRSNTNSNIFDQTDYNSIDMLTNSSYQKQTGPSTSEDWEFKADYSKKFSDRFKLETGMQSEWKKRYSENNIFNGFASGGTWTLPSIPDVSNGFDYDEQIHAMYGTLTGRIGPKLGYQLGLRGENTIIRFVSTDISSAGTPVNKNYMELFPTIFLNYNFSEGSDIQLNYSKRINRPRGRNLNPYVDISDSTNIRTGNPNLDPEYAHSFEMNFMKTWESHTLSSSIYHRITNHMIQGIRFIENGIMYLKPSNVTNSTSSGLELVSKDKISKVLETTATVNLYRSTMDGFTYMNNYYEGTSGFSWNVRVNGTLIFPKGFTGQASAFYSAPRIIAQGESSGRYAMDLGIRKSFFDNKLQLSVNIRNLLNSFKFESKTWGPAFYQETSNKFFGRDIRINLTWNFGNLKPKIKKESGESNENSVDFDTEN